MAWTGQPEPDDDKPLTPHGPQEQVPMRHPHAEHEPNIGYVQLWCTAPWAQDNPDCRVYVDGVLSGRFRQPITVGAGQHQLCVRGGNWKTGNVEFQVAAGEKKDFEVRFSQVSRWAFRVCLFAIGLLAVMTSGPPYLGPSIVWTLLVVMAFFVCIRYAPFANLELVALPGPGPKLLLIVENPYGSRVGAERPQVYVDGVRVGDAERTLLVSGGRHTICVENWFMRSNSLEVVAPDDGGPLKLRYGTGRTGVVLMAAMFGSLGLASYVGWNMTGKSPESLGMVIPFVMIGGTLCWLVILILLRPFVQTLYLKREEDHPMDVAGWRAVLVIAAQMLLVSWIAYLVVALAL